MKASSFTRTFILILGLLLFSGSGRIYGQDILDKPNWVQIDRLKDPDDGLEDVSDLKNETDQGESHRPEDKAENISMESKPIKISLVGDIMMAGSLESVVREKGYDYFWEDAKGIFLNDDLTIGNLETSITETGNKWPDKQFNFKSDPKNLEAMKRAGMDLVSLANNHSLDYGYSGFLDTLDNLNKNTLDYIGGGRNLSEAISPRIYDLGGNKIGVLAYSRVVPSGAWYASGTRPGLVGAYDSQLPAVLDRIKSLKDQVDQVIVVVHWGQERVEEPREIDRRASRKLIDAGADIIVGHHPHILQGVELYKGKPIIYSLGNFVFTGSSSPTVDTGIIQFEIRDKKLEQVKFYPLKIVRGRPTVMGSEYRRQSLKNLNRLSQGFNVEFIDGVLKF